MTACAELGVKHYPSTPYRHTSNGKAERWIRMCEDVVRSMLYQSGLGHPFWSQALPMACMLLNAIIPYRGESTPWVARRGEGTFPWQVSAFGSRVHALLHGKKGFESHGKFEIRGSECIFLGWEWAPGFVHCDYKVVPVAQIRAMDSPGCLHVLRTTDMELDELEGFMFPFFSNKGEGIDQHDAMFHHGDESVRENHKEDKDDKREQDPFSILTPKQLAVGWRVDKFGDRLVKTPPGSGRPSWLDPESWRSLPLSVRRSLIQDEQKATADADDALVDKTSRGSDGSLVAMCIKHVWFEGDERNGLGALCSTCMEIDVKELAQWAAANDDRQVLLEICCTPNSTLGDSPLHTSKSTIGNSSVLCYLLPKLWSLMQIWVCTMPNLLYFRLTFYRDDIAQFSNANDPSLFTGSIQLGHSFAWEWPAYNDLWGSEVGKSVLSLEGCTSVQIDGCNFGLADRSGQPVQKPWKIVTNSRTLRGSLNGRRCCCKSNHSQCRGSRAEESGCYTRPLVDCVHSAISKIEDRELQTCDMDSDARCAAIVQDEIESELTQILEGNVIPLAPQRTNICSTGMAPRSVLLGAYTTRGAGITKRCGIKRWSKVLSLVHELAKRRGEGRNSVPYCAVQITATCNGQHLPAHTDGNNEGLTDIFVLGEFRGGTLRCDGKEIDAIGKWAVFDGCKSHQVDAYEGVRISVALYRPKGWQKLPTSVREDLIRHGFPIEEPDDGQIRRLGTASLLCGSNQKLNGHLRKALGKARHVSIWGIIQRHANDEQSEWQEEAICALKGGSLTKKVMVGMIGSELERLPNRSHVVFEGLPISDVGVRAWREHVESMFDEVRIYRVQAHSGQQQNAGLEFERICIERGCKTIQQNVDVRNIAREIQDEMTGIDEKVNNEEVCLCMDRDCDHCGQSFLSYECEIDEHTLCVVDEGMDTHRTINGEDTPLWGLITRQIHPNEPEYHTEPCQEAMLSELKKLHQRKVWDHDTVMEFGKLMSDPNKSEVMVGRVFGIMGEKFSEEGSERRQYKGRIVFQGNNITTKTGNSPVELFAELANSPTTFTSTRAAIGACVATRRRISVRDVSQAYIQSYLNLDVETWVEIPRVWWPKSWFGKTGEPLYRRPVCRLIKALYGHPVSGGVWERHLGKVLVSMGWRQVDGLSGIWVKDDLKENGCSVLAVYVDDLLLGASTEASRTFWRDLEQRIEFKDPEEPLDRYLGANQGGSMVVQMKGYIDNAVSRFMKEWGGKMGRVTSPYLENESESGGVQNGCRFGKSASSYVATLLFLARVCRPDLMVAVTRLAKKVTKWTSLEDQALVRLMSYLNCTRDEVLHSTMRIGCEMELVVWSDADLCGDPDETKSTSGCWIELSGQGFSWPIAWSSKKQGSTSHSTCESETVALNHAMREEALPLHELICMIIGSRVGLVCKEDNEQTIAAVRR
eukprot:4889689-Amphidinium_carterae.1